MFALLTRLRRRGEDGGSAVEYALLASGIAAVIVLIVVSFGGVSRDNFSKTCSTLTGQTRTDGTSCNG